MHAVREAVEALMGCERMCIHDISVELAAALDVMSKLREYAGDQRPEMRRFAETWTVAKLHAERLCEAYVEAWKNGRVLP